MRRSEFPTVTFGTGLRTSSQAQLPTSFAALYPPVNRGAQGFDELAEHQDGIHDSLALQCRSDGRWRMDERSDGRFQGES